MSASQDLFPRFCATSISFGTDMTSYYSASTMHILVIIFALEILFIDCNERGQPAAIDRMKLTHN